jgi:hypothetical protein
MQRTIANKKENFHWHPCFKDKQNRKNIYKKQCLNKKKCIHEKKMQSKKQTTKQMGCEGKEIIISQSNYGNLSHVHY